MRLRGSFGLPFENSKYSVGVDEADMVKMEQAWADVARYVEIRVLLRFAQSGVDRMAVIGRVTRHGCLRCRGM